jgi:cardiolipin synthase
MNTRTTPAPNTEPAASVALAAQARPRRIAVWLTLLLGLFTSGVACRSSPPLEDPPASTPPTSNAITVSDARGRSSPQATARALESLTAEGKRDLMTRHLEVLAGNGKVDLIRGNSAKLLVDGPATFAAMKAAIARAESRVLLQSYIVEDQGVAADVAALLLERASRGVRVALLYDSVGSIGTDEAFFDRLRAGGVAVCAFNPVNPVKRFGYWNITRRDHRKILVVDNARAFTGGINISRVYGSASFSRRGGSGGSGSGGSASGGSGGGGDKDDALDDGWRDTQIELAGPVVPVLAREITTTWADQGCKGDLPAEPATRVAEAGPRVVKVIASDPRDGSNRIYTSLLEAIAASSRSVYLTMAYFAPGEDFVNALRDAARRGVDVQMVLPGKSDFSMVLHAGRSYYDKLLEAGVRIHEMEHALMHAKSAVIDGVFSTVGSSNLDWRSLVDNHELNVIVLGDDFGLTMEAMFERDRKASQRIDAAAWAERPWSQRVLEGLGRMAERWL